MYSPTATAVVFHANRAGRPRIFYTANDEIRFGSDRTTRLARVRLPTSRRTGRPRDFYTANGEIRPGSNHTIRRARSRLPTSRRTGRPTGFYTTGGETRPRSDRTTRGATQSGILVTSDIKRPRSFRLSCRRARRWSAAAIRSTLYRARRPRSLRTAAASGERRPKTSTTSVTGRLFRTSGRALRPSRSRLTDARAVCAIIARPGPRCIR